MLLELSEFHGDSFLPTTLHAYDKDGSENNSAGRFAAGMDWTIREHQDVCCGLLSIMFAL